MTSPELVTAFRLVDEYSRNTHHCFVAEFFKARKDDNSYALCFRPTGVSRDSPSRYECRYLQMVIGEIQEAASLSELPTSVKELLDRELPSLGRLR